MDKRVEEWLKQSDYDMDTATYMYKGGRYIYAVFMCHLSVEKALKGFYYERLQKHPPKTHNLVYLLKEISVMPPEDIGKFIVKLGEASIPTRYPEDLDRIQRIYEKTVVADILTKGEEVIRWIKEQL